MSCMCKSLKNDYDTEIAQGDWNTMYFRKENDNYYIRALGDGYVNIKINYCPFCGNKLTEDVKIRTFREVEQMLNKTLE